VHTKEITPMAIDESAVSELLDALAPGEGTDLVRELAQWALQQLIEAEATAKIGGGVSPSCCQPLKRRILVVGACSRG
jgi:hypothetical protein